MILNLQNHDVANHTFNAKAISSNFDPKPTATFWHNLSRTGLSFMYLFFIFYIQLSVLRYFWFCFRDHPRAMKSFMSKMGGAKWRLVKRIKCKKLDDAVKSRTVVLWQFGDLHQFWVLVCRYLHRFMVEKLSRSCGKS